MAKKELLKVGQKVWLETTNRHGCDVRHENEPCEMFVLEANKTNFCSVCTYCALLSSTIRANLHIYSIIASLTKHPIKLVISVFL